MLGIVSRPKRSVKPGEATPRNPAGYTEVVAARLGDAFTPIGMRDLRLNRRVNPKEGETCHVHYNGGFLSLAPSSSDEGTQVVLYAPKLGADGEPERAHVIVMDPDTSSITIAQADGSALALTDTSAVLRSPGGSFIETNDNEIKATAPRTFIHTGSFQVYVPNASGSLAHTIVVDDSTGSIQIVHRSGSGMSFNDDGSIVIRTPGGKSIQLSDAEGLVIDAPARCGHGLIVGDMKMAMPVALGSMGMLGVSAVLMASVSPAVGP
jgi:hypothetical protein